MGNIVSLDNSDDKQQFLVKIKATQGQPPHWRHRRGHQDPLAAPHQGQHNQGEAQLIRQALRFARVVIESGDMTKAVMQLQKGTEQYPKLPGVVLTTIA